MEDSDTESVSLLAEENNWVTLQVSSFHNVIRITIEYNFITEEYRVSHRWIQEDIEGQPETRTFKPEE